MTLAPVSFKPERRYVIVWRLNGDATAPPRVRSAKEPYHSEKSIRKPKKLEKLKPLFLALVEFKTQHSHIWGAT